MVLDQRILAAISSRCASRARPTLDAYLKNFVQRNFTDVTWRTGQSGEQAKDSYRPGFRCHCDPRAGEGKQSRASCAPRSRLPRRFAPRNDRQTRLFAIHPIALPGEPAVLPGRRFSPYPHLALAAARAVAPVRLCGVTVAALRRLFHRTDPRNARSLPEHGLVHSHLHGRPDVARRVRLLTEGRDRTTPRGRTGASPCVRTERTTGTHPRRNPLR